jgi:hypothetical protein
MRVLLKIELLRAIRSRGFMLALLVGMFIAISHYFQNVVPMTQYLDLNKQYPDMLMLYPHTVFNKWMGGESYTLQPFLYFLLVPALAAMAFGDSLYSDLKGGFCKNVFIKTKKTSYFFAKYVAVFLCGGIVVILPLLANLGLSAVTLPSLLPQVSAGTFQIYADGMWSALYYAHPYAYILSYLLLIFVFSGLLATVSLAMTFFFNNRFVVVLSPFLICLFLYAIGSNYNLHAFIPSSFLNPAQPALRVNFGIIVFEACLIALISLGIYFFKGMRKDTY